MLRFMKLLFIGLWLFTSLCSTLEDKNVNKSESNSDSVNDNTNSNIASSSKNSKLSSASTVKLKKFFNESYRQFEVFLKSNVVEKAYSFTNNSLILNLKNISSISLLQSSGQPFVLIHYCIEPLTLNHFQLAIKASNNCQENGCVYKFLYWVPFSLSSIVKFKSKSNNKTDDIYSESYNKYLDDVNTLKQYFSEENVIIVDKDSLYKVFGDHYSNELIYHSQQSVSATSTSSSSSNATADKVTVSSYSRSLFVDSLALYSYMLLSSLQTLSSPSPSAGTSISKEIDISVMKYLWMVDCNIVWIGDLSKVLSRWDNTNNDKQKNVNSFMSSLYDTASGLTNNRKSENTASAAGESNIDLKASTVDSDFIISESKSKSVVNITEEEYDYAAAGCIYSSDLINFIAVASSSTNQSMDNANDDTNESTVEIIINKNIDLSILVQSNESIDLSILSSTQSYTPIVTRRRNIIRSTIDRISGILKTVRRSVTRRSSAILSRLKRLFIKRRQQQDNNKNNINKKRPQKQSSNDIEIDDATFTANAARSSIKNKNDDNKSRVMNDKRKNNKRKQGRSKGLNKIILPNQTDNYDEDDDETVICHSDLTRFSLSLLDKLVSELESFKLSNSNSKSKLSTNRTTDRDDDAADDHHRNNYNTSTSPAASEDIDVKNTINSTLNTNNNDDDVNDILHGPHQSVILNVATYLWMEYNKNVTDLLDDGLYYGVLSPGFVPMLIDMPTTTSTSIKSNMNDVEETETVVDIDEDEYEEFSAFENNAHMMDPLINQQTQTLSSLSQTSAETQQNDNHEVSENESITNMSLDIKINDMVNIQNVTTSGEISNNGSNLNIRADKRKKVLELAVLMLGMNYLDDNEESESTASINSKSDTEEYNINNMLNNVIDIKSKTIKMSDIESTHATHVSETEVDDFSKIIFDKFFMKKSMNNIINKRNQLLQRFFTKINLQKLSNLNEWFSNNLQMFSDFFDLYYPLYIHDHSDWKTDMHSQFQMKYQLWLKQQQPQLFSNPQNIKHYFKKLHLNEFQMTNQVDFNKIQEKFLSMTLPESSYFQHFKLVMTSSRPGVLFRNLSLL